jgi:hypothetical protein
MLSYSEKSDSTNCLELSIIERLNYNNITIYKNYDGVICN